MDETQRVALIAADEGFFDRLVAADTYGLQKHLADDFMIVDVGSGNVVPRSAFIEALAAGMLTFSLITRNPQEATVRLYGNTGIIINKTELQGALSGVRFEVASTYTHVFVRDGDTWMMVSAQGTAINP